MHNGQCESALQYLLPLEEGEEDDEGEGEPALPSPTGGG